MKKKLAIFVLSQFLLAGWADAQQAYFIDGYHGGIYGHYPVGQTAFIAQKLRQNPNWNINIEIEPESWEVVRQRDPEGYEAFKRLFKDQSVESGRFSYCSSIYFKGECSSTTISFVPAFKSSVTSNRYVRCIFSQLPICVPFRYTSASVSRPSHTSTFFVF